MRSTARLPLDDAMELFGIPNWGQGYFGISPRGELTVRPTREPGREVVLSQVLADLRERGFETPLVFRFPQILQSRVRELTGAFNDAIEEFDYEGSYRPLFPFKVNQRRGVITALLAAGRERGLGLEVGSRAELMAALALDLPDDAMIVVNGYKDRQTLALARLGARMGRRVVVVLEKLFELEHVLESFREAEGGPLPELGVRTRLFARGSGKWWKSSGTTAKFGLSTAGILEAVDRLRDAGFLDRLSMLHFHIGSQIPEIRRLKKAFREAARIYAKLRALDVPVRLFNVGGGLAVDYDGSTTASDASKNYSIGEYANDVVYIVREVCREEGVALPTLLSESGRALAAYHSLLVGGVLGRIEADSPSPRRRPVEGEDPRTLVELQALHDEMGAKTWREFYHDAVEHRDELMTMFDLGLLTLEQRARADELFWSIARAALAWSKREKTTMEEFEQLERALEEKYILNFSVFQSAPDHWALDQLFPIVPLTRLLEPPSRNATIVDITCDSDGEIDRFVDLKDVKESLVLHDPGDEPYDLAILLLGAYQDVMGDMHNLFGTPDDVYVTVDEQGRAVVEEIVPGDSVGDVLGMVGFDPGALRAAVAARLERAGIDPAEAREYDAAFAEGTYLRRSSRG